MRKAFLIGLGLVGLGAGVLYDNFKSYYHARHKNPPVERHYDEVVAAEPELSQEDISNLTSQMQGILERPMEFRDSKLERLKILRQAYGEEAFSEAMRGVEWAYADGKSVYDQLLENHHKKCGNDIICALHASLGASNYSDPRFFLKNTRAYYIGHDGTFPGEMPFWYWEDEDSIYLHSGKCGTGTLDASLDDACRERFQHYILMSLLSKKRPFQGDHYSIAEGMRRLGGGVFVDAAMQSSTLEEFMEKLPEEARKYSTEELMKRVTLYTQTSLNSIGRKDDDKIKHIRYLNESLGRRLSAEILGPMNDYEIVRKALEEQQQ